MRDIWQKFALKVGAWIAAALLLHFLATIFLAGAPPYLASVVLAMGAVQIGLLDRTPLPAGDGKMLKRGIGLLMICFAAWLGLEANTNSHSKISWQIYSDEILEMARKAKRPVIIDFTLRGCAPCDRMDRSVFSNNRVGGAAKDFIALRVNASDGAEPRAWCEKFGVNTFPTIVFIGADGKERGDLRMIGFEDAAFFVERLERAR